jgi:hypothetical protein
MHGFFYSVVVGVRAAVLIALASCSFGHSYLRASPDISRGLLAIGVYHRNLQVTELGVKSLPMTEYFNFRQSHL